jgi:hypothetical protein
MVGHPDRIVALLSDSAQKTGFPETRLSGRVLNVRVVRDATRNVNRSRNHPPRSFDKAAAFPIGEHQFDMLPSVRDHSFITAAAMSRRKLIQLGGASLIGTHLRARALDEKPSAGDLKIADIEFTELTGHHQSQSGVDSQYQVNPLDVYDDLRRSEYKDQPGAPQSRTVKAIYLRIRTRGGAFGLYGPVDIEPAVLVNEDLRAFLIGKDALAGKPYGMRCTGPTVTRAMASS